MSALSASPSTPVFRRVAGGRSARHSLDASGSASPGTPLRPTTKANQLRMNDDKAERAARRRSAHFADLGLGNRPLDSKENGSDNNGQSRKPSALAVQSGQSAQGQSHVQRRAKRLSAVTPAAPVVSMEVMNTNFEEWMKLATDNKITATNTWNFALIDYFHDLTLLRNGPDDQSINFQKASCTLDGCVKIWTSRVDSVATETGKLLSGLAGGKDDANDDDGDDEDESGEPKAVRKTHRSEATLAKSFDVLRVKKLDLEFTVDPLFKKTSADFDEGGAMGLLMNHLGIDGTGRVVFDASDAVIEEEDEEEEEEVDDRQIDISKLRELMPSEEETAALNISDTLAAFAFTSNPDDLDLGAITGLASFSNDPEPDQEGPAVGTGEAHDFFGDEDFDTAGPGGFDEAGSYGGDDDFGGNDFDVEAGGALGIAMPGEGHGPFDPSRTGGQDLVMAFVDGEDGDGMFDYFDKGFAKAWAGAEHWKLRKVSRKDAALAAAPKGEKKAAKAPFTIDFSNPEAAQSAKALFAPGTKASTQLPSRKRGRPSADKSKSTAASRRDEWLLPDDMHFSSRQLLRLFLKPKFALRTRRQTAQFAENANGEIDETFWAQAAADRADGDLDPMDVDSVPLPFESQFFHDDDGDDAFVDDNLDVAGEGGFDDGDDLWQQTQGQELRRPRPENVHYAKRAKRIDVKRLKDDIWNDLKDLVDEQTSTARAPDLVRDTESEQEPEPQTPTEPVRTFDNVINTLRTTYPKDKMAEISTSFCFICLLHLANEEGLRLETARSDGMEGLDMGMKGYADMEEGAGAGQAFRQSKRMDEGERVDRVVGELQALRVFKDPNAGRAA